MNGPLKIFEQKMKNPWQSCHPFCWFHRVYGMQNDQVNLTVILAEKNCKIMHYSRRYLYIFDHFSSFILQISLPTKHYFAIFFSKNDREIEPVVLHTINPQNSTKWVTTFSWIFHFLLIDFSKKIFDFFSQMPGNYLQCARSKNKKNFFWGGFTAFFLDC